MKHKHTVIILVLLAILTSCILPLDTIDAKQEMLSRFSYAVGVNHIKYSKVNNLRIPNAGYCIRAVLDKLDTNSKTFLMNEKEMLNSLNAENTNPTHADDTGKELTYINIKSLTEPTNESDKYGYAYGYYLCNNTKSQFPDIVFPDFIEGLWDAFFDKPLRLTAKEREQAIYEYNDYLTNEISKTNLKEANDFMAQNSTKEGVISLNEFCQIKFHAHGPKTEKVKAGNNVILNYVLTNIKGDVIDIRKNATYPMTNKLIVGFVEGCLEMYVGDSAIIYIHPEHGYGNKYNNNIEPNTILIFDVDILGIEK